MPTYRTQGTREQETQYKKHDRQRNECLEHHTDIERRDRNKRVGACELTDVGQRMPDAESDERADGGADEPAPAQARREFVDP
jgi:hypothetical protein